MAVTMRMDGTQGCGNGFDNENGMVLGAVTMAVKMRMDGARGCGNGRENENGWHSGL